MCTDFIEKMTEKKGMGVKCIPKGMRKSKVDENNEIGEDVVICRKHWPIDAKTKTCFGKDRPIEAPSIFQGVPKSLLPTPLPPMRTTARCLLSI